MIISFAANMTDSIEYLPIIAVSKFYTTELTALFCMLENYAINLLVSGEILLILTRWYFIHGLCKL